MLVVPELICREATADDWSAIWPIFAAVVSTGDTYAFDPEIAEADARAAWMLEGTRQQTFVAVDDDRVVATAIVKPNQPGLGDHVANAAWMVAPSTAGRGVGRRLAEHVLDAARAMGFTAMQFNAVVETNLRAVGLWQSLGFDIVGTVPGAYRHRAEGAVGLHIMHRQL